MDTKMTQEELNEKVRERFKELPKVVQDAITSADVEKHLRALADTNKLHLDQWQLLENEVLLTLLGYQPTEELADNLKADLEISMDVAIALANDISRIVFEPIREELERELEHPAAKTEEVSDVDVAHSEMLEKASLSTTSSVVPATPPPPSPSAKAERGPASGAYKPGETSTTRKTVDDDPYREPPQ